MRGVVPIIECLEYSLHLQQLEALQVPRISASITNSLLGLCGIVSVTPPTPSSNLHVLCGEFSKLITLSF